MVDPVRREYCVLTGNNDIEPLYTIHQMPVKMSCVNNHEKDDLKMDMIWGISTSGGCIQLMHLVPLTILYGSFHGSGTVGKLWNEHHTQFCEFISSYDVSRPVEVGAGHGNLARAFVERYPDSKYFIVDPNTSTIDDPSIAVFPCFFDEKFDMSIIASHNIDAIIHSHYLEHDYDVKKFIQLVSKILSVGQKHIFSVPRLEEWIRKGYNNALHFEHTVLLTEDFIDSLIESSGFRILEKKYFGEDHSVFYATEKVSSPVHVQRDTNIYSDHYERNRNLFLNYIEKAKHVVQEINTFIDNLPTDHDIFLFGAHVFSQFLICLGLHTDKIQCILDNDETKQDKRLYGTRFIVHSPQKLKTAVAPVVIVYMGPYSKEVISGIEKIRSDVIYV